MSEAALAPWSDGNAFPPIALVPEDLAQAEVKRAIQDERRRQEEECLRRAQALILCESSLDFVQAEMAVCAEDFVYFCEHWVWIEEPRNTIKRIPFLMYDYQKRAALEILGLAAKTVDSIEKYDVLVEKTRDMGWSWLMVALAVWLWLFHDRNILFGSEKAEKADKLGNMLALLEKCRYVIRNLPDWMLPPGFQFDKHMGENLIRKPAASNHSGTITADSANPDFGRGDRKYIIILDEFASWPYDLASATACGDSTSFRIFISTPKGPHNLFAQMATGEHEEMRPIKITSHWTEHPIKAAGGATDIDGKKTSPYYRFEKSRKTPDQMASEIDINYAESTKGRIFHEYVPSLHRVRGLKHDPALPIVRVWDPGIDFYVLFLQIDKYSRVLCLREELQTNAHVREVAESVLYASHKYFNKCSFVDYGDPAGYTRSQSSAEKAEFELLKDEFGIHVDVSFIADTPTHLRIPNRLQAIKNKLTQWLAGPRSHALLLDPDGCETLDRALVEGYRFKVDKYTKKVSETPEHVHPYCDAVDCLGYGILAELGTATSGSSVNRKLEIEKNVTKWTAWGNRGNVRRLR